MSQGPRVKQTLCRGIFQATLLRLVGQNGLESQSHAEACLLASLPVKGGAREAESMRSDSKVSTAIDERARHVSQLDMLRALEQKILWLAVWTIHHANHIRPKI